MMKGILLITSIVLLTTTLITGCQQQAENFTGPPPPQAKPAGPLTLEITSPRDGRETPWGFTSVEGTVSPPDATVIVNGISVAVAGDGSFESDFILLDEGKNELRAVATLSGKSVSRSVTVTYNIKLHISISLNLPPGEDWFTVSPAEIGGRVSDPRAEVTVNGNKARVSSDGYISAMLNLDEGINTITATARLGDQVDTDTREAIYVRPVPLAFKINTPTDGQETDIDLVKVSGTVSDPQARVMVNNIPAPVTATGAFYAYIGLDEGDNCIDAVALRSGEHLSNTIYVSYRPPLINPAEKPALKVTSPQNGVDYNVNLLPITGTVSDPAAKVLVDGIEAAVAADGSFQGYALLEEGENNIEVIAIREAAKTVQDVTVTFIAALVVYLEQPSIDWNTDYTKEPLTVIGRVNKPEAGVTVNDEVVTVAPEGSFTASEKLQQGSNSIKAIATLGDERDEVYILFMVENGRPNPVPGYSSFFMASLRYEQEISLKAGETLRLPVTLETRKDGPGRMSGRLYNVDGEYRALPRTMPDGLDVYLEPPGFMAYPNTTYSFNIVFNTTPELVPGSYYLHFYHNFEGEGYGSGWIQVIVE
jgi:nitrogen fixation protein FixH